MLVVVGLTGPQVHRDGFAAELEAFAFTDGGWHGREKGGPGGCTRVPQRPARIQQVRVEEPLDGRLPRGGGGCGAGGERVEKPLLPLLPDPLQLPEPLLQQGDGGEHHLAVAALHPHDDCEELTQLRNSAAPLSFSLCVTVYFARCVVGFVA